MDWGSAIGGIASAAGSVGDLLTGGYFSRKAWERQKEAMKHAHQWEVQDLRAAGLNPILSAGGSGASTGGLTSPMVESNFGKASADAFVNALMTKQMQTQEATSKNIATDTDLKKEKVLTEKTAQASNLSQAGLSSASAKEINQRTDFYEKHPEVLSIHLKNKAFPTVGGAAAALELGIGDIVGSAKSAAKIVHDAVSGGSAGKAVKRGVQKLSNTATADPNSDSWNGGD